MAKSLDEIYAPESEAGSPPKTEAPDAGVKPEAPEAPAAQPQSAAKTEAPPASDQDTLNGMVPRAALEDERKKRRDLEQRIARLEQGRQPEDQSYPDPIVDPDAFIQRQAADLFQDRLAITEEILTDRVGADQYRAAEKAVLETARANPEWGKSFADHLVRQRNPAKFTYEVGQQLQQQADMNDPVKARERLKAEILAELGHAPSARGHVDPVNKPSVPVSLASVPSSGPRNAGPRPVKRRSLDELYR